MAGLATGEVGTVPPPPQGSQWRASLRNWARTLAAIDWSHIDWAPDLAEDIGSRRWKRGFASMLGLMLLALAFWPNFSPLEAAPASHGEKSARDEFRSQLIMPLGLSGDSGRHMAASRLVTPVSEANERPRIELAAILTPGDSFGRLLQRAGVSPADAAEASELVAGAMPLGAIEPGTRVQLVMGPRPAPGQPRALQGLDFRAKLDLQLAVNRHGDALALERRTIPVDTTPLRIRGTVGPSLYRSARAAGVPVQAIQQYLQALDSHIDLEGDIRPGDSFDLIMSYKRAGTGGADGQAGDVLYVGLERGNTPVTELVRWGSGGQFMSADAITHPVVQTTTYSGGWSGGGGLSGGMIPPVVGRITSGFGMRYHPILGYARLHAGVDFGAAWGSSIRATADGIVSFAGRHGGHGNFVRLDHGGGLSTGYGHMSSIAVSPGTQVRAGQVIGYVGSTGLSTGPHLHYEMYQNGRTVNPLGGQMATFAHAGPMQVRTIIRQVDAKQLAAFKARLAELKAIRPGGLLGVAKDPRKDSVAMVMPRHTILR
jgi:murein DD-endopeptidase MepM/ murein hydrolase activator NlpD